MKHKELIESLLGEAGGEVDIYNKKMSVKDAFNWIKKCKDGNIIPPGGTGELPLEDIKKVSLVDVWISLLASSSISAIKIEENRSRQQCYYLYSKTGSCILSKEGNTFEISGVDIFSEEN